VGVPPGRDDIIYADASARRLLSDISGLVTGRRGERLLVAGDFNILLGYGEHGDAYFAARYQSVFYRAAAMGLRLLGPRAPHGRQAAPWPAELSADSGNVPTFHHSRQTPETATRQLDFVFATENIADRVQVRALNSVGGWGPSDHCRVAINVDL
jgi:endonuclease/exonuclease/phosphatase family metal-dependent hydrolase